MTVISERSIPVLMLTYKPFALFFLPYPAEEGEW